MMLTNGPCKKGPEGWAHQGPMESQTSTAKGSVTSWKCQACGRMGIEVPA